MSETIQDKLKAAASGNASALLKDTASSDDNDPTKELPPVESLHRKGYRTVGHRYGLQCCNRIIRADSFGYYEPLTEEETKFLDSKVAEGFLIKVE